MIARRTLIAAAPLVFAGCGRTEEAYFGKTDPPQRQRLVYLLEFEPTTLDPALSSERMEDLMLSLFEGLTSLDPATGTPMAALATHYEATADELRFTFYLRGHPAPRGFRLPGTSNLRRKSASAEPASSRRMPARWSDGMAITAHDFVYSWRRAISPATAAREADALYCLRNGEQIGAGKLEPENLGVRAPANFTLEVELEAPTPYFLELVSGIVFCPVPRHAVEEAGPSWTEPGRLVSSGAFMLRERRSNDRIVLERNPLYYEAGEVALSELVFVVVTDGTARVNLYRSGGAAVTGLSIPAMIPTLRRRRDFEPQPTYASSFVVMNTTAAPFDDVRVRHAFNMATDKRRLADLNQAGSVPAVGLVPPTDRYPRHRSLCIDIDGATYDVLSFNPPAARQLLLKTDKPLPARMEFLTGNFPDSRVIAQVLKQQWREYLGIDLTLRIVDIQSWVQSVYRRSYQVADWGSRAHYLDPAWFLDLFRGPDGYGTGWSDPQYVAMLAEAKNIADPERRMARLAQCERRLLEAMPILPYSYDVASFLKKPFVKGLGNNLLGRQQFKYVWIDTNWRPRF